MTPSLLLFISLCAVVSVVLAFVVILPWLKGSTSSDNRLMMVNVDTFYERLAELEDDHKAGVLSQEFYDSQVVELKRQLLDAQSTTPTFAPASVKSRVIVLVWIPILVGLLYAIGADRTPVFKLWQAQDTVGQVADDLLTGKIDTPPEWATKDSTALISAMQTNVHRHAYDPNRWMRLSELFLSLEASPQALEALARAHRLAPDDETIALTYAQIGFFANKGSLNETGRQILAGILGKNPNHEGAMMLFAMGETQAGNFDKAKAWVTRLRSNIAGKSGDHSRALASLDELMTTIDQKAQASQNSIQIGVSIAKELLPQVVASDVLFVTISDKNGSAPYAVKRLPVSELKDGKIEVSLSDADAMMPNRTLSIGKSEKAELIVNARISKSGTAVRESGDLMAESVVLGDKQAVALEIGQVVP